MPPKKAETPSIVELPDQPPTFDNDQFMDDLLQRAKTRNVESLELGVAAALKTEDYHINLRQGVLVDFVVETILFASQQSFPPRKTAAFIKWMDEMRASIESTGNVEGAKLIFKNHLVSHAERSNRDAAGDASNIPGLADEPQQKEVTPAPAAPSKPPASKKDAGKKGAVSKGNDEAASRPPVDTNVFLSVSDMGAVSEFIVTGLLQHWQLYHYAATAPDPPSESCTFTVTVQTAIKPPPLSRAITQEQYDQQGEDERAKAEAELQRLRDEEAAALEAQRQKEEAAEAERQRAADEEEANKLYFSKVGTEKSVDRIQEDIESNIKDRQQQLIDRLVALEKQVPTS